MQPNRRLVEIESSGLGAVGIGLLHVANAQVQQEGRLNRFIVVDTHRHSLDMHLPGRGDWSWKGIQESTRAAAGAGQVMGSEGGY